jgi:hypothetical protein
VGRTETEGIFEKRVLRRIFGPKSKVTEDYLIRRSVI